MAALNVRDNPICCKTIGIKAGAEGQERATCKDTSFEFALNSSWCGKLGINNIRGQKTFC